jgi:general secretion pathway protein D
MGKEKIIMKPVLYMHGSNSLRKLIFAIFLILTATLIASCAGIVERADEYAAQGEWIKAVLEYRKALISKPHDVEYKSRLKQAELKAADYYYQSGMKLLEQDNADAAIEKFQQGLMAMPDHAKLIQAINTAAARKEAGILYMQAQLAIEAGKYADAKRLLKNALNAYQNHKQSIDALNELEKQLKYQDGDEALVLASRAPITLNFRQTDMRTAFEFVAKSFGVDVIFDEAIRSAPVTLFAKDVTFYQALNLMLATTKTFNKQIGPNTILIAPDTKEKRAQYEDQYVRSFQLSSIGAKEMSDIIKGLVNVKKIIINESLNAIVIRDTEDVLKVVDRIVEANDRRAAELILEVEILEVNRTKAERLGLDLGSYSVKAGIPSSATIPTKGSIPDSISNTATLTLPSVTFNFYKQDVDAKTLANPRIRVLSGKNAKIHIGDRVPLRSATFQSDLSTQVRTTYDYKDIGIRLNVDPVVHVDNSVTVKVGLEVSSLGENIGTQSEPAYRIGTRNAETYMLLRDGETAILGGLIREEERATRVGIPGIGDVPAVGSLLSSHDNSANRTDVLLTITPRVVRGKDFPVKNAQNFPSGTEERYMTEKLFGDLTAPDIIENQSSPKMEVPVTEPSPAQQAPVTLPSSNTDQPAGSNSVTSNNDTKTAVLSFSQPVYEGGASQEFQVSLTGEQLANTAKIPIEVLYNPQLVTFIKGEAGDIATPSSFTAEADAARGIIRLLLAYPEAAPVNGSGAIAKLTMRAEKSGTSYLVYRTQPLIEVGGKGTTPQVRSSRVVIK